MDNTLRHLESQILSDPDSFTGNNFSVKFTDRVYRPVYEHILYNIC